MNKLIVLNEWKRDMKSIKDKFLESNIILNYDVKGSKEIVVNKDQLTFIYDIRKAAEVHKIVRRDLQEYISNIGPGIKILDIANKIETDIKNQFGKNDLTAGIAFPPGLSINNVICHDTANSNDQRTIGYNDICKVDFGTHVNGYIIDSAFSVAFNPEYENLLNASKEATNVGLKLSGPDALIYDISKEIKEVIESYEVTIKGKTHKILPIKDLGGHNIKQYDIHAGQLILCSPCDVKGYKEDRMRQNEFYAIETFATTGTGNLHKSALQSNHYMLNKYNTTQYKGKLNLFNDTYHWIKKNRSPSLSQSTQKVGLPFCPRWMENDNMKGVTMSLNELSRKHTPPYVIEYLPLEDVPGSYVSHFEHTMYLHEYGKEIMSAGDDY
jgi:methionyl aminopeptidase